MLRFVPYQSQTQTDGRHVLRACTACRKRKKRCYHDSFALGGSSQINDSPHEERQVRSSKRARYLSHPPAAAATAGGDEDSSHISNNTTAHSPTDDEEEYADDDDNESDGEARFVGHLNPESAFLAATSPTLTSAQIDNVGVWISRQPATATAAAEQSKKNSGVPELNRRNSMPVSMAVGTKGFRLEELALQHLPEEAGFQALYTIYLEEIHPIFPVIDREAMEAMSVTSPECSLLRLAVCIAASVNPRAKEYLKPPLRGRNYYSSRDGLIKDMIFSLRLLLSLGLVKDKIVLVQALSLVALFTQYAKDRDLSAELAASAIGHSHTAGIHLENQGSKNDGKSEKARGRLFCCVWALDKLNAATQGRPVMMHERDIGRDVTAAILEQQPSFQLLLWIVMLLDRVIEIYRPHSELETFPEGDFPLFEDLIDKTNACNVNSRFLATAEILYHSVAMLSCRVKSLHEPATSSAAFLRQSLSAIKATSLVSEGLDTFLSNLPFIPYAISLSLRVAYRDLRTSRSPMLRERAKAQLLANSRILHRLGGKFGSVTALANMAEQSIHKMDRQSQQRPTTSLQTDPPSAVTIADHPSVLGLHPNLEARMDKTAANTVQESSSLMSTTEPDEPLGSERIPHEFGSTEADLQNMDLSVFDSLFNLDMFSNFEVPEEWS
ncbi:hypothetical protein PISL3812_03737 [Talaromyces islandicus]|uniref:Xylanolytic transcriptional activator regulatory domain-containing protein n=1 Tax=Talaromyces islandicus TaxID=28573 RepID=A0A0U1LV96_TALIS|nr:hypothetical protein PISL3812_03737 [Talaromyces islandicus]